MGVLKSHFDDCPYHCNANGMLLDTNVGRMIKCPHCSKKKQEMLSKGIAETVEDEVLPLSSILGISSSYLTTNFVYDAVVPDGERIFIEEGTVEMQKSEAEELYYGLTVGQLPERSLCFGLGYKGRIDKFAYPMLAKAYSAGLNISKFISCSELTLLNIEMSDELKDFYSSDLAMVLINDGCSKADLASAKGLMQIRAQHGKPTVFVTTWSIEACSVLLGYFDDITYFMAKGIFLKYKTGKKRSHYINQITGEENDVYSEEGNEGTHSSPDSKGGGVSMDSLLSIK